MNIEAFGDDPFPISIASSVPYSCLVFMILKTSIASSTPLSVIVVYVLVSVGLYFSTPSTPTSTTTRTTANTESYDVGNYDVDDEDDTMERLGAFWGRMGRYNIMTE